MEKQLYLGAAYYPECWSDDMRHEDYKLMAQANCNVMRIAEFAWSDMEPAEGEYTLDWLHKTVRELGERGIYVIMCTPTCTPPQWLLNKHPEIAILNETGKRLSHGKRRHTCPNVQIYRNYIEKIVTKLAVEFKDYSNIIGWQIDNEIFPDDRSPRGCFCDECAAKFRALLKKEFGTIEKLNDAWNLSLWSQKFESFDTIVLPTRETLHHPSLVIKWRTFVSDSYVDFCDFQADILHKYVNVPVGTDMMPRLYIDYYKINKKLDVVQFNHYNDMETIKYLPFWYDYLRPMKDTPFWVTETSTCWNGAMSVANNYRQKGFCFINSIMPFAFGGEANLYWLWRAHKAGQEQCHGSVVSSCSRPLHTFEEVKATGEALEKARDFLCNTHVVKPKTALICSTLAYTMLTEVPMTRGFEYIEQLRDSYHKILNNNHIRLDVIDPSADISGYDVIFAPYLPDLSESGFDKRLKAWVYDGGKLIAGPFTDIRNKEMVKFEQSALGMLEQLADVYVKYEISQNNYPFDIEWKDGEKLTGSVSYTGFELGKTAQSLADYTEYPFEQLSGITKTPCGKGYVIMLGTTPDKTGLVSLCNREQILPELCASENVMGIFREGGDMQGLVVMEYHNRQDGYIELPYPCIDLITNKRLSGKLKLSPYEALILIKE